MRLDLYLVNHGGFESRNKAASAVSEGRIKVNGAVCTKASKEISENDDVSTAASEADEYVGRAALKLEHALTHFGVDVHGMRAVDIGASTGGFTQSLLKHGAAVVYAVDVGRDQLHEKLKNDVRVISIEGFNARELTLDTVGGAYCDIAVMDVSFISQTLLYDAVKKVLSPGGIFISLIKPQFELTKSELGKNGVVKSEECRRKAVRKVTERAKESGFRLIGVTESPIEGGSGNTEYLACFRF